MFEPQNTLERSLVSASSDPAARPQFYRDFVKADLFIVDEGPIPERHERRVLEAGHTLKIRPFEMDGETYIPVFSSLPRLQAFVETEVGYLAMNALELIELTRGAKLFLNPGSDYGKAFLPEEIEAIIDGSIWRPAQSYTVQRDTQVLIGQPANYPMELVDVLKRVFSRNRAIKKAYLAHFFNPEHDDKPHTLIAIEAREADWNQVVAEAGMAADAVKVPDPPVDFIRLEGSTLASYFQNVEPFYRKKKTLWF